MAVDVLCVGSMIVDERFRESVEKEAARPPLRLVAAAPRFVPGGMTIVARAMTSLGLKIGVIGRIGEDIPGWGLRALLEGEGVNTQGLIRSAEPTGFSRIALSEEQRWIEHCIGANAKLCIDDIVAAPPLGDSGATLCAIGYAGLLPALDADGGQGMVELMRAARQDGMLTALDLHTMEGDSYPFLEKSLPEADIFLCNAEEAAGIAGTSSENALESIWNRLTTGTGGRSRLAGITLAEAPLVRYGTKHQYHTEQIVNPWFGTFEPKDLTGAGDCFRAGLYAEVLFEGESFRRGQLDLRRAVLMGCCASARALSAADPRAVGPLEDMKRELAAVAQESM